MRLPAPPARTSLRWAQLLALLGICLPVPICAASGLSLPLPATVERIAASLVPWAGVTMSANEALQTGASGSIVAGTDERSEDVGLRLASLAAPLGPRTKDGGGSLIPPGGVGVVTPTLGTKVPGSPASGAPAGRAQPADGAGPTPSGPGDPQAPAPGVGATPPTEPAPPPVRSDPDPVAAVKPVVDEVLAPVAPVVETTTRAVEETVAPLAPALPGVGK